LKNRPRVTEGSLVDTRHAGTLLTMKNVRHFLKRRFVCKQVNRLLKALQRDPNETDSDHSGEGSNTDSGRGPSEEGETARTRLMAAAARG